MDQHIDKLTIQKKSKVSCLSNEVMHDVIAYDVIVNEHFEMNLLVEENEHGGTVHGLEDDDDDRIRQCVLFAHSQGSPYLIVLYPNG